MSAVAGALGAMRNVLFFERQSFHPLFNLAAIGLGVSGLVMLIPAPGAKEAIGPAQGFVGFAFLLLAVIVLNVLTMTTWVYEEEVRVQFGRLIPYYNKRIKLHDVTSCRVVEYRPIRSTGGWGIRSGKFEGRTTGFLNARGTNGVLLETDPKPYLIGTQYSEKLAEAVEQAREALPKATAPG